MSSDNNIPLVEHHQQPLPQLSTEKEIVLEPIELIKCENSILENNKETDMSSFDGVKFSRTPSEGSMNSNKQKETTDVAATGNSAYWTINDDEANANVDAAAEADEESIALSLRQDVKERYPFLNIGSGEPLPARSESPSIMRKDPLPPQNRGRSVSFSTNLLKKPTSSSTFNRHGSRGSLVKETTAEVIADKSDMTYKVISTKERLTLDNAMPSLDNKSDIITTLNQLPAVSELSLDKITQLIREIAFRYQRMPFFRYRLFTMACLLASYFVFPGFVTGMLCGLYLSLIAFLFVCVSDPITPGSVSQQQCEQVVNEVSDASKREELMPKVYKGWMNILNEAYNPRTFHVNRIQTVLVRLDGNMLRISRPERQLLKHAFYDDPTLGAKEPTMLAQSIYDLTNASVKLRPKRLAKRRWFSRKYPICIRLASPDNEIHSRNEDRFFVHQSKTMGAIASKDEESSESSSPGVIKKLFRRKKKNRSRKHSEKSRGSNASGLDSIGQSAVDAMSTRSADGQIQSDDVISHNTDMTRDGEGYISDLDLSAESDGDIVGVHRSFSAEALNRVPLVRLQANFPGAKTRAFRNIYLFGRSAREKERWFHILRKACNKYNENPKRHVRKSSLPSKSSSTSGMSRDYFLYMMDQLQFSKHLEEIMPDALDQRSQEEKTDAGTIFMDLGRAKWQKPAISSSSEFQIFANLMATRLFYDFCRDEFFCGLVKYKIQNKLASIHLPYFIENLELSKFEIGTRIPKIQKIYTPTVDDWGIWFDIEVYYEGCIRLVLETKADLMKLKDTPCPVTNPDGEVNRTNLLASTKPLSHYSDEEVAESPESSPDEDYGSKVKFHEPSTKEKTGQKILHLVDKVAHSKIFNKVADLKPVKKALEEVSSTRLVLNVEITSLEGTLALNLPPPPSDRLWYAFRDPPQMSIKAVPQVGDRSVALSTVSDWIVNKIRLVLEKNLVLPNMDDIKIPVLGGNALLNAPLNQ